MFCGLVVFVVFFFENQLSVDHSRHGGSTVARLILIFANQSRINCGILWLQEKRWTRRHLLSTNDNLVTEPEYNHDIDWNEYVTNVTSVPWATPVDTVHDPYDGGPVNGPHKDNPNFQRLYLPVSIKGGLSIAWATQAPCEKPACPESLLAAVRRPDANATLSVISGASSLPLFSAIDEHRIDHLSIERRPHRSLVHLSVARALAKECIIVPVKHWAPN